jgi:sugar phosphate isomerase/epimerase
MSANAPHGVPVAGPVMSRRSFVGAVGVGLAGAALAGAGYAGAASSGMATGVLTRDKLGLQLFSCIAAWEADGPETLALISQIGYSYVEFAVGYGSAAYSDLSSGRVGMPAKTFRKALDDNGLWCNAGHGPAAYPYNDKAWKQWVEDNLVIGTHYLGTNSAFPTTEAECKRYVDAVHKGHEVARRMGYTGSQFNHLESWSTLTTGPTNLFGWEYVARHTPRDVWNMEFDGLAYSALGSIGRINHYIRKYPGRWSLFHFKDLLPNAFLPDGSWEGGAPAEFGTGAYGLPDPSDPNGRPHAGFQDLLTAIRESQNWDEVLIIAEGETPTTLAVCADYSELAYKGLNGLTFPYRKRP